eukprot:7631436-Prorocentrum_lima.AAC.1
MYVWLEKPPTQKGISKALAPLYEGPYMITQVRPNRTLVIKKPGSQSSQTVNRHRVKPYFSRDYKENEEIFNTHVRKEEQNDQPEKKEGQERDAEKKMRSPADGDNKEQEDEEMETETRPLPEKGFDFFPDRKPLREGETILFYYHSAGELQ